MRQAGQDALEREREKERERERGAPSAAPVEPASRPPSGWLGPRIVVLAILGLAALVQLVQVDSRSDLGDSDLYLLNARAYADGHLAHSRFSPGFGLLLSPLARLAGDDVRLLTLLAELAMVPVAVGGLVLLHRLLRHWLAPWTSAAVLAAFALGQAAAMFVPGIKVGTLAFALVTGALLALANDRAWWAAGLGAAAMLARVALAPFFAVLWIALLLRRRSWAPALAGLAGLAGVVVGVVAHFASGPTVDQSYLDISSAIYVDDGAGTGSAARRLAGEVAQRGVGYFRYGIPRLVAPFRILASPIGLLVAAAVVGAVVVGMIELHRRAGGRGLRSLANLRGPGDARAWTLTAAAVAFAVLIGGLLVWPIPAAETTRLVIPVLAVPLLGLGGAVEVAARRLSGRRLPVALALAGAGVVVLANLASTASVLRARNALPEAKEQFVDLHWQARDEAWAGPAMSRFPAFTELVTGRTAYSYPLGAFAEDVSELAERSRACDFVLDEVYEPMPPEVLAWIEARQARVVAAAGTARIVEIRAPWCP